MMDNSIKVTFLPEVATKLRQAFSDPKNPNRLAYGELGAWLSELVMANISRLPTNVGNPGQQSQGARQVNLGSNKPGGFAS